ncbi:hypothetical protein GCM10007891_16750 [Methylophaga thalassica]|uniref:Polysaccharide pyruvyl transferase domain-containing protein n=1 Tax=Methylophaga thalassica TaxID=40223 RepID=A0ABQ5TUI4_9GAMM|nr:hypothetical protein GCM10007891_16750 [Methylophaga thalassica]
MIIMSFNNRNDNFGDQLIFSLLYKELSQQTSVYLLNNKPNILSDIPVIRIRQAFKLAISARFHGETVSLLDPPCARLAPRFVKKSLSEKLKTHIIQTVWRLIGVKRCVVGISVATDLPVDTFRGYRVIGLRDKVSLEQITKLHKQATFCPDMACLMTVKKKTYRPHGTVMLSFRKDVPEIVGGTDTDLVEDCLGKLLNADANMLNKDNVKFYAQVDEDVSYNRQLALELLNQERLIVSQAQDETYYAELFADCQLVISNRLHVLLPAMLEGIPTIALVSKSHAKIVNLLESYGLEHNILFIEDVMNGDYQPIGVRNHQSILKHNYEQLLSIHEQVKDYLNLNFG